MDIIYWFGETEMRCSSFSYLRLPIVIVLERRRGGEEEGVWWPLEDADLADRGYRGQTERERQTGGAGAFCSSSWFFKSLPVNFHYFNHQQLCEPLLNECADIPSVIWLLVLDGLISSSLSFFLPDHFSGKLLYRITFSFLQPVHPNYFCHKSFGVHICGS